MSGYEKYEHFGNGIEQWVKSDLKGKHRDHCLCWNCVNFDPDDHENNCNIARSVYALCVEFNMVIPVWECPYFEVL